MKNSKLPRNTHEKMIEELSQRPGTYYSLSDAAKYFNHHYTIRTKSFGRNKLIKFFQRIGVFQPGKRIPHETYEKGPNFLVRRRRTKDGFQNATCFLTGPGLARTIEKLLDHDIIEINDKEPGNGAA